MKASEAIDKAIELIRDGVPGAIAAAHVGAKPQSVWTRAKRIGLIVPSLSAEDVSRKLAEAARLAWSDPAKRARMVRSRSLATQHAVDLVRSGVKVGDAAAEAGANRGVVYRIIRRENPGKNLGLIRASTPAAKPAAIRQRLRARDLLLKLDIYPSKKNVERFIDLTKGGMPTCDAIAALAGRCDDVAA